MQKEFKRWFSMQMVALYFHYLLVYILKQNKLLNRLALLQKSETKLPFTNKGGITEIFLLYKNLFNIDQYFLEAALRSLSLLVILCV